MKIKPNYGLLRRFSISFYLLLFVPQWSQGGWFMEPGLFYSLGTAEIEYSVLNAPLKLKGPYRGVGFRARVGRDFPAPLFFWALEASYLRPSFQPEQSGSSNTEGTSQSLGLVLGANISMIPVLGFQGWVTYVPLISQKIDSAGAQTSFKTTSGNGFRIGLGKKSFFPMLYYSLEYFVENFSDIEVNARKLSGSKLTNKGLNLGLSLHFEN